MSSTILISSRTTFFSRSMSSGAERRAHHDVGQHLDGQRQVLVEHLDVIAGVFLRRKRVHLAADGVDRLRDVLGAARGVPLNSMCSTKCAMPLCSCGSWREPRASQTPMLTERTCGICSVRRRRPLGSTSRTMAGCDTDRFRDKAAGPRPPRSAPPHQPQTIDRQGIRRTRAIIACEGASDSCLRTIECSHLHGNCETYTRRRDDRITHATSPSSTCTSSKRHSRRTASSASTPASSTAGSTSAA